MKVKQLIEKLSKLDPNKKVYYYYDDKFYPINCILFNKNKEIVITLEA